MLFGTFIHAERIFFHGKNAIFGFRNVIPAFRIGAFLPVAHTLDAQHGTADIAVLADQRTDIDINQAR